MRFLFRIGGNRFWVITPEPAQGLGENSGGVLLVVAAIAPGVVHVITRELKRRKHFLIREKPVASVIVQIVGAILKEHSDRPGFRLANQRRIIVASAEAHECADAGEDPAKGIRPLPRCGKGADGPAAGASN